MFPFKKHYLLTWHFAIVFGSITYIVFIAGLQRGGVLPRLCLFRSTQDSSDCCSDMLLFSASDLDVCIKRFLHSSQSSYLPSSTFMDSAFLFLVFFSPDSGQGDGCCVMSVIALILPFSQHFNSFMLLPNLYWAIICILYMITFPLPVVWQLWGLHSHADLRNTCCCCLGTDL